jgi:hypothetical protein
MELHVHLGAAYPTEPWVEHFDWLEPLFNERLEIENGRMIVPTRPGLGVSLSEKARRGPASTPSSKPPEPTIDPSCLGRAARTDSIPARRAAPPSETNRERLLATLVLGLTAAAAQAAWPDKPVTLVVPFPPGGSTDAIARAVAPKLQEKLGGSFIVDNKAGAGGTLGAAAAKRAAPTATPSSSPRSARS